MNEYRTITELHEWQDNPRNITPQDFDRLKKQISKLGQYKPLLITDDGEVIGGNMRLKAYRELGIKDIWVSVVKPKDDNEKLEYALSDNDRAGYYDDDMLANLIPNYQIDWSQYAVDMKPPEDIQKLIDRLAPVVEDEAPPVAEGEAVSKLGEVYSLGRHRLMCGDSTKIEDVEKLMDGKKADMVFTDPPYGVEYDGTHLSSGTYFGKGQREKEKLIADDKDIYSDFIGLAFTALKDDKVAMYMCFAGARGYEVYNAVHNSGFEIRALIIWNKNHAQFGSMGSQYKQKHEPILYLYKNGKSTKWNGANNEVTVWDIDRQSKNEFHLTEKPVSLSNRAIRNSSDDGDIILDLFGGSGSTLIASEQTNRICYMMELDPKYCDVIRKRYAKFIGKEEEWEQITPPIK